MCTSIPGSSSRYPSGSKHLGNSSLRSVLGRRLGSRPPRPVPSRTSRSEGLHVFIDLSNIFIGVKDQAAAVDGPLAPRDVRVSLDRLLELVRRGRKMTRAVAGFGARADYRGMMWHLERLGVETLLLERDGKGREIGVDEALQAEMRAVVQREQPGVLCLLSGDGAGSHLGRGFLPVLQEVKVAGWSVEVYSWRSACNSYFAAWAHANARLVLLDSYYDSITFLEGTRGASRLRLRPGLCAQPLEGRRG